MKSITSIAFGTAAAQRYLPLQGGGRQHCFACEAMLSGGVNTAVELGATPTRRFAPTSPFQGEVTALRRTEILAE